MSYENKTNEELIDLLEGKDDRISELEEELQEAESQIDDVKEENVHLSVEISRIEDFDVEKEPFAEAAFNEGYKAKSEDKPLMKAWLNYKIEARL